MPKETMTRRERWQAVFDREKPDRVPMDIWITGEAQDKLIKHLGVADQKEMLQRLHIDKLMRVAPPYAGPPLQPGETTFGYGVIWQEVDYGTGKYLEQKVNPLAKYDSVEEIEANYRWPSPDDYDYSDLPRQVAACGDHPIEIFGTEAFNYYRKIRGGQQAYMDLLLNPDIAHYCLDHLFEIGYQKAMRIFEAIPDRVMLTYVVEDFGCQQGLLFSRKQIHEFLVPGMKRMMDLAHEAGSYVYFHSDGACREVIPDMIDIGIDLLNPIQWRAKGMEREALKRDFGDKVVFHGGVDNQYTLPFGTVEEVRQEVVDNLRILGAGGGYILAPCHNIQAVGPPENAVALYEAGYEHGWT